MSAKTNSVKQVKLNEYAKYESYARELLFVFEFSKNDVENLKEYLLETKSHRPNCCLFANELDKLDFLVDDFINQDISYQDASQALGKKVDEIHNEFVSFKNS